MSMKRLSWITVSHLLLQAWELARTLLTPAVHIPSFNVRIGEILHSYTEYPMILILWSVTIWNECGCRQLQPWMVLVRCSRESDTRFRHVHMALVQRPSGINHLEVLRL